MELRAWLDFAGSVPPATRVRVEASLERALISLDAASSRSYGFGVVVIDRVDDAVLGQLQMAACTATVLVIVVGPCMIPSNAMWELLESGATDVLLWQIVPEKAVQVAARLERWKAVQQLLESAQVKDFLVGNSPAWRNLMRSVIEISAFTQANILITGETGTGKELIARLIHCLDPCRQNTDLTLVDCTTISPELSGSEFFGHERGAFTGAANGRDGAFALANGGMLFLDEVGELSLTLQAQLLRVIQEHKFKRVGSNNWQHTEFRLVCATNRDLETDVANGTFRADLFYRIAGWRCQTPALRKRKEDILPLVRHFLMQLGATDESCDLDPAVRDYFLTRDYPGNVRDLRQLVTRIWFRHAGPGPISIGDVPTEERLSFPGRQIVWPDQNFETSIRHALESGIGLKEIGQFAADVATQIALEQEDGNVQRAALRLGITDRALQMRRANARAGH